MRGRDESREPVIVGVGQVTCRDGRHDGEVPDPLGLMETAARRAAADSGTGAHLMARLGSLAVVDSMSWPAGDPAGLLADRLGASPRETVRSGLGGNAPQSLVADVAAQIAGGRLDVALVAGAEAVATLMSEGERDSGSA